MMLEASLYKDNTFCTLTYDDKNLPNDGSVHVRDVQLFMKKLRKSYDKKIRFFACGEYGDIYKRPHYHLALFNYPNCLYGISRISKDRECCATCANVSKAWGKGFIQLGALEPKSMGYIAGYVCKKMTRKDDPRLEGKEPEFARMSLRPGLGYDMMHEVAHTLMEYGLDETLVDVPPTLAHGSRHYPLGRYLRRNLRKMIGRDEKTPQESLDQQRQSLQELRDFAFDNSKSFSKVVAESTKGRRIQIEARQKRQRKTRL